MEDSPQKEEIQEDIPMEEEVQKSPEKDFKFS